MLYPQYVIKPATVFLLPKSGIVVQFIMANTTQKHYVEVPCFCSYPPNPMANNVVRAIAYRGTPEFLLSQYTGAS